MSIEPTNVVDLKTKKAFLPFQVRAILMAQYVESKNREKSAEDFLHDLEDKLLASAASTAFDFVRSVFNELKESKND